VGASVNGGALFARHALLAQGWTADVLLEWDGAGTLLAVTPGAVPAAGVEQAQLVLPGMVNLHSHAFQRALGGLTETAGNDPHNPNNPDSFWTWRELMYRFARNITPGQIEAIAAQLFAECLRHGYTAVCEFHYVQRAPGGGLYPRPAETAERIVAASRAAGIGLTMLPVLYSHAGFGEQALGSDQQRFRTDPAQVLGIVEALEGLRGGQLEVGAAPHSLRAATIAQVKELARVLPAGRPLHIHIAEQQDEVRQCIEATGMRPLRYLAEHVALDERWCLVHATHIDADEVGRLARANAVAGLCPTTEANLGDGIFPLAEYIDAGGRFGIGSDSHVSQSPVEELRWLEYGQRLRHQRRNVAVSPTQRRVGDFLWQGALRGGAQASGRKVGALGCGMRADLLVLDSDHPNLDGAAVEDVLGGFVFAGNDNLVRHVLAGGRWVVRGGRHVDQDAIVRRYKQTLVELREYRS
jgi:formimidoylglutamate deiminase